MYAGCERKVHLCFLDVLYLSLKLLNNFTPSYLIILPIIIMLAQDQLPP